jgi:hypothetical protein
MPLKLDNKWEEEGRRKNMQGWGGVADACEAWLPVRRGRRLLAAVDFGQDDKQWRRPRFLMPPVCKRRRRHLNKALTKISGCDGGCVQSRTGRGFIPWLVVTLIPWLVVTLIRWFCYSVIAGYINFVIAGYINSVIAGYINSVILCLMCAYYAFHFFH